jgi:MFS family permease
MIPSRQRATLISINSMFFSIGMIILFPIAGFLADKFGLAQIFAMLGMLLFIFVVGFGKK